MGLARNNRLNNPVEIIGNIEIISTISAFHYHITVFLVFTYHANFTTLVDIPSTFLFIVQAIDAAKFTRYFKICFMGCFPFKKFSLTGVAG